MRILGLTVGRNEQHRYLEPMLWYMRQVLNGHFFYDDRSDDDTPLIAKAMRCVVVTRPDDCPSFVESEGAFRENAWKAFEHNMAPTPDDYVIVIDCDEVLVAAASSGLVARSSLGFVTRCWVENEIAKGPLAINLNIPEVFGFEDGHPLVRVDRLWGTIHAPRLFRYQEGGSYFQGGFGVPAVPTYVQNATWATTNSLALMHYGYATPTDQQVKYARYVGREGHSNAHVESIIEDKLLEGWPGPYVKEMVPCPTSL